MLLANQRIFPNNMFLKKEFKILIPHSIIVKYYVNIIRAINFGTSIY